MSTQNAMETILGTLPKKTFAIDFQSKKGGDVRFVVGVVAKNTAFDVLASKYLFALSNEHTASKVTVCVSCQELDCVNYIIFSVQN